MQLKLGDPVWVFDGNRRVYRQTDGRPSGSPLYREHWRKQQVVHENRASYFVGLEGTPKHCCTRVSKKDVRTGNLRGVVLSLAALEMDCWVKEHRYKILEKVRACSDYNTLRTIAALVSTDLDLTGAPR